MFEFTAVYLRYLINLTEEDASMGHIRNSTRQEIIRLILRALNQPSPNLAHFLLGFETCKPVSKTNLQDPGENTIL